MSGDWSDADTAPVPVDLGVPSITDAVEIGRGGFAVVYRCHRLGYEQTVAVKLLSVALDAEARRHFEREVHAMDALFGHPHVVGIIAFGYNGADRPYIVMEDMTQGSVAEAVRRRGRFEWKEAASVGADICDALEAAHTAHVLHRDVKPENALYSRYGAVKLGDFGLAALSEGPETRSTSTMVSLAHTAPEVLDGQPRTPGTDVYALASTIMTLIIGRPPFARGAGETTAAVFKRISTEPPPDVRPLGVPDALCRVLERAMAKSPAERYGTAASFRADLDAGRRVDAPAYASPPLPDDPDRTVTYRRTATRTPEQSPPAIMVPTSHAPPPPPPAYYAPAAWQAPQPWLLQPQRPGGMSWWLRLGCPLGALAAVVMLATAVGTALSAPDLAGPAPIVIAAVIVAGVAVTAPLVRRIRAHSVLSIVAAVLLVGALVVLWVVGSMWAGPLDVLNDSANPAPAYVTALGYGVLVESVAALMLIPGVWITAVRNRRERRV